MIRIITGAAMRTRRIVMAVLLSALVAGAVVTAISNDTAQAQDGVPEEIAVRGGCGQNFNPVIGGAKAHWNIACVGNKITLAGWVEDTKKDGRCAYVKVNIGKDWWPPKKACPKGDKESFSYSGTGRTANGYLFVS
jgi:hypothetical protein